MKTIELEKPTDPAWDERAPYALTEAAWHHYSQRESYFLGDTTVRLVKARGAEKHVVSAAERLGEFQGTVHDAALVAVFLEAVGLDFYAAELRRQVGQ